MHTEEKAIRKCYADYLATFHTLDSHAVAEFYAAPCIFIAEQAVMPFATFADVERFFQQMIENLQACDYDHSEVIELHVELLGDALAQLRGVAIRYRKDGSELERMGAMYTLRKCAGAWKFVTALTHPA